MARKIPAVTAEDEIRRRERFEFGNNWRRFSQSVDEERISSAERSLREVFGDDLQGKRFLDAGCGSGIFSLAARRLGARVHSFDFDPTSVSCTEEMKHRYLPDDPDWTIETGSVLDATYLAGLGHFDFVYSWGVLHHTGDMERALRNIMLPVSMNGALFISIYNDQGVISSYWKTVKRLYNRTSTLRPLIVCLHAPYLWGLRVLVRAISGRLRQERGMSLWHDMIDWLGGYPFEVASPGAIIDFYQESGYRLLHSKTCGRRHGCNEFVLSRSPVDRSNVV